jgi:hypothetical protein
VEDRKHKLGSNFDCLKRFQPIYVSTIEFKGEFFLFRSSVVERARKKAACFSPGQQFFGLMEVGSKSLENLMLVRCLLDDIAACEVFQPMIVDREHIKVGPTVAGIFEMLPVSADQDRLMADDQTIFVRMFYNDWHNAVPVNEATFAETR